jgi:hypothetical protein
VKHNARDKGDVEQYDDDDDIDNVGIISMGYNRRRGSMLFFLALIHTSSCPSFWTSGLVFIDPLQAVFILSSVVCIYSSFIYFSVCPIFSYCGS